MEEGTHINMVGPGVGVGQVGCLARNTIRQDKTVGSLAIATNTGNLLGVLLLKVLHEIGPLGKCLWWVATMASVRDDLDHQWIRGCLSYGGRKMYAHITLSPVVALVGELVWVFAGDVHA